MKEVEFDVCTIFYRRNAPVDMTEGYYSFCLEDEDYERLEEADDWDDVPDLYDKVYTILMPVVSEDYIHWGLIERDDDVDKVFGMDIYYPTWEERTMERLRKQDEVEYDDDDRLDDEWYCGYYDEENSEEEYED